MLIGAIIGAAIVYFGWCKTSNMKDQPTGPKGIITPKEIKTLDAAFDSRHKLISDTIVKRPDNRSSWYSLKDMREYLDYAENQAKELGYNMDGIRVYLGANADEVNTVGFTTMFFVPTGSKNTADESMPSVDKTGSKDIPGGYGLDMGSGGDPPNANYPQ